jgi:hypothetical protein
MLGQLMARVLQSLSGPWASVKPGAGGSGGLMPAGKSARLQQIGALLILALTVGTPRPPSSGIMLRQGIPTPGTGSRSYATRHVFVVSIDGLRGSEAFDAPDPAAFIPNMWNRLRPLGSLYRNFYNLGATWTTPGNHTIVDGCWEITPNIEGYRYFRPACPTMFEYYRRAHPEVAQDKAWAVVGKNNCDLINYSWHPFYGAGYGASLEPSLQSDRSDEATWSAMRRVMDDHHPSLVFFHLGEVDHAGHTNWSWYLEAIRDADRIVAELWDTIQGDPYYRDQTTMLVTTDHGRHDDGHGGFKPHGGICEGDKRLFLLAIGPDIKQGQEFWELRQLTDVCPTVGRLMGFDTPFAGGRVLGEMLVGYDFQHAQPRSLRSERGTWQDETRLTLSPGTVEQPDVAVNAAGLHVVWVDDRSGSREVYYKVRPSNGEWSDDQQLTSSGVEARAPSIASDGETVHVVWQDYRNGDWSIYHRERTVGGSWSEATCVVESTVEVGTDPGKRCEMTMEPEITVCQGQPLVGVPLLADRLRLFRRAADGSWEPTTVVDAPPSQYVSSYGKILPQGVAMASGDYSAFVFWQQVGLSEWVLKHHRGESCGADWQARDPPTFARGCHDVSAAAYGTSTHTAWLSSPHAGPPHALMYAGIRTPGSGWSEPAVISSDESWHPDLAAGPGVVALAWEDYRDGLPAIYLARSMDNGISWAEQRISYGDSFSVEPATASDGQTVYVVWRDRRDGNWQLYLGQVSDVEPSPTPTAAAPTHTATPTPTASPTATATTTQTATPTVTVTATTTMAHMGYLPIIRKGPAADSSTLTPLPQ